MRRGAQKGRLELQYDISRYCLHLSFTPIPDCHCTHVTPHFFLPFSLPAPPLQAATLGDLEGASSVESARGAAGAAFKVRAFGFDALDWTC